MLREAGSDGIQRLKAYNRAMASFLIEVERSLAAISNLWQATNLKSQKKIGGKRYQLNGFVSILTIHRIIALSSLLSRRYCAHQSPQLSDLQSDCSAIQMSIATSRGVSQQPE